VRSRRIGEFAITGYGNFNTEFTAFAEKSCGGKVMVARKRLFLKEMRWRVTDGGFGELRRVAKRVVDLDYCCREFGQL
jgi:hypothetical protein